ncbi:MAG: hypothetical protein SGCHY_003861, partial [Lobulomycetales sp.]
MTKTQKPFQEAIEPLNSMASAFSFALAVAIAVALALKQQNYPIRSFKKWPPM